MAKRPNNVVSLLEKQATFVQHSLPGLRAGKYQITVQQELDYPDGQNNPQNPLPGKFAPISKKFGVTGPKYQLNLKKDIHSVFPVQGASNEFSNDLAHIVLVNEKLPWLRSPYAPKDIPEIKENIYNGDQVYDDDVASWFSVFVFANSDFGGTNPMKEIKQGTIQDLVPANKSINNPGGAPIPGTLDQTKGYSIFSYYLESPYVGDSNPIDPGIGHKYSDTINYIDIPAKFFNGIAPSLSDLKMSAHVREVTMSDKPLPLNTKVKANESFGLVIGNRLPESFPKPQPGAKVTGMPKGYNVAMAVSLENMQYALEGHSGTSYYDSKISSAPDGFVRLPVMYKWSFVSWFDTSANFENVLKGLNGRPADSPDATVPVPNSLMRIPNPPNYKAGSTDDKSIVQTMLELGYAPYNHITRVPDGDNSIQTVSWFRGPLLPFKKDTSILPPFIIGDTPADEKPNVYAADKLLRFDPNTGMYDVSYAAAWQLGRLLSLGDKSFSVPLYQWKKQVEMQYRMLLENQVLHDQFGDVMALYRELVKLENPSTSQLLLHSLMQHLKVVRE